MTNPPAPSDSGGMRFFGWVSILVGAIITLTCGSCTAYWGGTAAWDLYQCQHHPTPGQDCQESYGLAPFFILMSVLIGGPPIVVGIVMIVLGVVMQRRRRRAVAASPADSPVTQVWSKDPD